VPGWQNFTHRALGEDWGGKIRDGELRIPPREDRRHKGFVFSHKVSKVGKDFSAHGVWSP